MNGPPVFANSTTALLGPQKTHQFNKLKDKALLAFSIINIVLGILSCVLHTAALVPFSGGFSFSGYGSIDVVGYGIWAGIFYIIAGFLGYSASYKPTKSLLVSTIVLSVFAMLCSIAAATMSGIAGGEVWYTRPCRFYVYDNGEYNFLYDRYLCNVWEALEFSLLGFSVLAMITNIVVLSLASAAVCCSSKPKPPQQAYYVVPNTYTNGPWVSNQFMVPQPAPQPVPQPAPVQSVQQPQPQATLPEEPKDVPKDVPQTEL